MSFTLPEGYDDSKCWMTVHTKGMGWHQCGSIRGHGPSGNHCKRHAPKKHEEDLDEWDLRLKLRQMHRRAQKAEGQRDRALQEVEAWQDVLGKRKGRDAWASWLVTTVLASLQKVLTK